MWELAALDGGDNVIGVAADDAGRNSPDGRVYFFSLAMTADALGATMSVIAAASRRPLVESFCKTMANALRRRFFSASLPLTDSSLDTQPHYVQPAVTVATPRFGEH